MFNGPVVAGIALFVFYAVAFTKSPFSLLIKDPAWSNWAIRLWALVLGVAGAVVDAHFTGNLAWGSPALYGAVKDGAIGTIVAILTYHVGQKDFVNPLDGNVLPGGTTVTVAAPVVEPPTVTVTKTPPIIAAIGATETTNTAAEASTVEPTGGAG